MDGLRWTHDLPVSTRRCRALLLRGSRTQSGCRRARMTLRHLPSHGIVIPGEGCRPHGGCSLSDLSEMCIRDFKNLVNSLQRSSSCPCAGSDSPGPAGTRALMLRSRGSLVRCLSMYSCVSSSAKWERTVSSGCITNTRRCGLKNRHLLPHILEAGIQDPGVSGLAPPDASPAHADTVFSPCPHVVVPPCESVS